MFYRFGDAFPGFRPPPASANRAPSGKCVAVSRVNIEAKEYRESKVESGEEKESREADEKNGA
jgi:hypothetical protein